MANNYYTILTDLGVSKVANATIDETVEFTKISLGSGEVKLDSKTTKLEKEEWSGNFTHIYIHEDNPNWLVLETVMPADVGGFTIRELAIFDEEDDLLAIGNYPPTYKPQLSEGSTKDLYLRIILEVSSTENISLVVDPNVVIATKQDYNLLESRVSTNEENIISLGNIRREVNRLKVQLELSDRAPMAGGTFFDLMDGTNFKGLVLDKSFAVLTQDVNSGSSKLYLNNINGFKKDQEVTLYDGNDFQVSEISDIDTNDKTITLKDTVTKKYVKGACLARSVVSVKDGEMKTTTWGTYTVREVL